MTAAAGNLPSMAAMLRMGTVPPDSSEYVYTAQTVPIPLDFGDTGNYNYRDDKVFFSAMNPETGDAEIYSMNIDGTELSRLPGYSHPTAPPDGTFGQVNIQKMAVDSDNCIWVVEEWHFYKFPEGIDSETEGAFGYVESVEDGCIIRRLDARGTQLLSFDILGIKGNHDYLQISALTAGKDTDGEDIVYLALTDNSIGKTSVFVYGIVGDLRFRIDTDYFIGRFVMLPDGTVAFPNAMYNAAVSADRVGALQVIDVSARALSGEIEIPKSDELAYRGSMSQYYTGGDGFDVLVYDGAGLFAVALGAQGETVELLKFVETNAVIDYIQDIFITDDGRIICTDFEWGSGLQRVELLVLTKTLRSELPEKTVLTLLVPLGGGIGELSKAVSVFNATNLEYKIEVRDYSDIPEDGTTTPYYTKLVTELTSGIIPDIMMFNGMSYADFAKKGLLANIYELIDADPELDRSDFVQTALEAIEIDGALYVAPHSFQVETVVSHPDIAGTDTGWNIEELTAVLDAHPEADIPMGPITKKGVLYNVLRCTMDKYIDAQTGTVSFDSPEFVQLLELCNRFPDDSADTSWETAISQGRQIMAYRYLSGFNLYLPSELFGEETVWKGFPTDGRNGHLIMPHPLTLAIAEDSPHKDAAWSFVRMLLSKDWQIENVSLGASFPTNQVAFDHSAKTMTERAYWHTEEAGLMQEQYTDRLLAFLETAADWPREFDDRALLDIILEVASGYFNGLRSAEDVAADIQRCAAIYVSERS